MFLLQLFFKKDYDNFFGIYFIFLEKFKRFVSLLYDFCVNIIVIFGNLSDLEMMEIEDELVGVEKLLMNVFIV